MNIVYYEGDRIYFRPVELEDEPLVRQWINDPQVWRTLCHHGPLNACREREWIENQGKSEADYVFGIVVREADRLIGTAGLHQVHRVNRSATFGIALAADGQNQGYGSEATRLVVRYGFEQLNLNRIALRVYASNARAIRVYEKAGFAVEGRCRQEVFINGRYEDVLYYAILREQWAAMAAA